MRLPHRHLRLQTKVLLPVVSVMVALLVLTLWVVNRHTIRQFETQAAEALGRANAVLHDFSAIRSGFSRAVYGNIANEPRVKSICQLEDAKTVKAFLNDELLKETGHDAILLVRERSDQSVAAVRPGLAAALPLAELERSGAEAIQGAIRGQTNADTVLAGGRLFDLVSVPVSVGGNTIAALTFFTEAGPAVAGEIQRLTQSEIVILANNQVAVSTLAKPEAYPQLVAAFAQAAVGRQPGGDRLPGLAGQLVIGGEHFRYLPGFFQTPAQRGRLGYLLLSSYEGRLTELRASQQLLLAVGALTILLGSVTIWALVRKLTEPLRRLQAGAEAVGRGDFSRRVEVRSRDECGELAVTFNQMTENVQRARHDLETTIDTLKTTQAQLVQSERLSAIGEFIAGITHELNNPLTAVLFSAELLKQGVPDTDRGFCLEHILAGAQRCHKIVKDLLGFARQRAPERKLVDPNELVEATLRFVHYSMRTSNVQILRQLAPRLPLVLADPHQLQQVFLNLATNARQAIEAHSPKGWVRVSTETDEGKVRVVFQDSGPGVSAENLAKLFQPFFTTKEVGKGTGLGLSLCRRIIEDHGGAIQGRSSPGEGATFTVELPAAQAQPTAPESPRLSDVIQAAAAGCGQHVLVVDDEGSIVALLREALKSAGYVVDTALDGEAALRHLSRRRYEFVLCDWKMPGLNGQQIHAELRRTDPAAAARLIFMTGDVLSEKFKSFLERAGNLCLAKPFSLEEFHAAVLEITQRSRPAAAPVPAAAAS